MTIRKVEIRSIVKILELMSSPKKNSKVMIVNFSKSVIKIIYEKL
jgi:hypothetical protein